MGVVGERLLQDIIDHMEWEVSNGAPRDIASRELFERCAEALEMQDKVGELGTDVEAHKKRIKELEEEVEGHDEQTERALKDALEDKEKEHKAELGEALARITQLEQTITSIRDVCMLGQEVG